ncbi:hypothetical protein RRG08_045080, partial [Elysia crispata]
KEKKECVKERKEVTKLTEGMDMNTQLHQRAFRKKQQQPKTPNTKNLTITKSERRPPYKTDIDSRRQVDTTESSSPPSFVTFHLDQVPFPSSGGSATGPTL